VVGHEHQNRRTRTVQQGTRCEPRTSSEKGVGANAGEQKGIYRGGGLGKRLKKERRADRQNAEARRTRKKTNLGVETAKKGDVLLPFRDKKLRAKP